ncbi:MAG: MarR family transcriptional regulator [Bacteroidia bacterium]|nr:MarR family transcriptional regulator [Bacteroidia bacterium]
MKLLTETYAKDIAFSLSCFDRLIITGTLPEISYGGGMTSYLFQKGVKIFDYPKFAEPFKELIRSNAESIAKDNGVEIEFIRKSGVRKESIISKKIGQRGIDPGIVHIISVMETCNTFKPWHDKATGKTFLRPDQSKCLHYYFYFIDEQLGLGYVRVPTWCPFRLQVYINGHNLLASELKKTGITYTMIDNAFDSIENVGKAQEISDNISVEKIHRKLEELAWKFCPVYKEFNLRYHWSIMQAEYATDIVFKKQEDLQQIYGELMATAIHTVKPENIATFLGHKLDGRYQGEVGNNYNVRIEGSRVKHTMGSVSIKMYDKFSKILRIETTANDISFFKHYREVVHRDGTTSYEMAALKKNIYSLGFLGDNLKAANKRYLEFISAFNNKEVGRKRLEKVTESKTENNRNYKGFNFFSDDDLSVLLSIVRGEFNISGFRNKHLQKQLGFNGSKISRLIKRLRIHGLIKKTADSYKYYITKLGKETIIMAEKIKGLVLVPAYCY